MLKRIIISTIGVTLIGFGIALTLHANMGTDPFSSVVDGVAQIINVKFWYTQMAMLFALLFVIYWGNKHYIGFGTILTTFYTGFVIDTVLPLLNKIDITSSIVLQLAFVAVGVLTICFGVAVYMDTDTGLSTYDALGMVIEEKTNNKFPFKYNRVFTDLICIAIAFSIGATIGVGTIITAFFTGPIVAMFKKVVKFNY